MSKLPIGPPFALALAMMGSFHPANAQTTDTANPDVGLNSADQGVEEIVVTAQKRTQSVQDVPIAITAFGGSTLERRGTPNIEGLISQAPGLSGHASSNAQQAYTIRGVGSNDFTVGNDPAVGIYLDEVFIGRAAGAVTNFFDLNRVEVVRGPQGTLFGRNATAGAISIFRNQPGNDFEGSLSAEYGRFDTFSATGVLNLPISDALAVRTSAYYRRQDGDNPRASGGLDALDDVDTFSGRIGFGVAPAPSVRFELNFDYQRDRNSSVSLQSRSFTGQQRALGFYETSIDRPRSEIFSNRDIYMIGGKLTVDIDDATITSISSFRNYDLDYGEDFDASPANLVYFGLREGQDAYSQELRLSGTSGRIDYTVGGAYYREDVTADTSVTYDEEDICGGLARANGLPTMPCGVLLGALSGAPGPLPFTGRSGVREENFAAGRYTSWGIYADATFHASNKLDLILGGRYSRDRKAITLRGADPGATLAPIVLGAPSIFIGVTPSTVALSRSWGNFSPRAVLRYEVTDEANVYASYSRGYKSGGFNVLFPNGGAFDPEKVTSYEVGLKARTPDRRLTLDLAGYYFTYSNLQVQVVDLVTFTQNAGSARGYGAEAQLAFRPIPAANLSATLSWVDAKYSRYMPAPEVDYSGNSLNRAPEFSGSLNASYGFNLGAAGTLTVATENRFQTEQFFDPNNSLAQRGGGFIVNDARITYATQSGQIEVSLFGNNILGEKYIVTTRVIAPVNISTFRAGDRPTYGVRAKVRF